MVVGGGSSLLAVLKCPPPTQDFPDTELSSLPSSCWAYFLPGDQNKSVYSFHVGPKKALIPVTLSPLNEACQPLSSLTLAIVRDDCFWCNSSTCLHQGHLHHCLIA